MISDIKPKINVNKPVITNIADKASRGPNVSSFTIKALIICSVAIIDAKIHWYNPILPKKCSGRCEKFCQYFRKNRSRGAGIKKK